MSVAIPSLRGAIAVPEWAKNELWRKAQAAPSLDLRFADFKSLADAVTGTNLIDVTRASSGTYVGSDGLIKTATTNTPRFNHDPTTGESLGLMVEEQRSNLLLNSGTLSTQSVTVTAVDHALSFTGTGTVTLSGASTAGPLVGTGTGEANRVSLTFTPTAGSLTLTVSGTVTDAQLEAGSFPTSYIPTEGSAVTRAADLPSISGANFSSWYRQDEGTVFAEGISSSASPRWIGFNSGGGFSEAIAFGSVTASSAELTVRTPGATTAVSIKNGFSATSTSNERHSIAYRANDFAVSKSGGITSTVSGNLPISRTQALLGVLPNGFSYHNGTIRRLTYWPTRLSDATLQAITQ